MLKKISEFFLLILISISLTYLYVDTFLFGALFAYLSVIALVILWTSVLFYFYTLFFERDDVVIVSNQINDENISSFLIQKERIDYKKIIYSISGVLFSSLIVLIIYSVLDKEWAIGSLAVAYAPSVAYIVQNWIIKKS